MKTKANLRDIRILQFAVSALVLVLMARFAILPALEKRQALREERGRAEEQLAEMQGCMEREEENRLRLESAQAEFEELAASYYPVMETQEIDSLLTGIALAHSLFPVSLSISPLTSGVPEAYLYSDAPREAAADEDEEDADPGEEGTDLPADDEEMVKEAMASFIVSGSESNIFAMIDDLEKDYPAIRVCSFRRSENVYMNREMEPVRENQASFTLAVTMYER